MDLELHDLLLCEFSKDGDGPHYYNCWNLCREVYRRAGQNLPMYAEWTRTIVERDETIRKFRDAGDFIKLGKPEFLTLVGLKLSSRNPRLVTHIGVVVSKNHFIQIRKNPIGVSIERLDSPCWINKMEGFYRYVEGNQTK